VSLPALLEFEFKLGVNSAPNPIPAIRSTRRSPTQFHELVRAGNRPDMFERFDRLTETAAQMLAAGKDLS
jgi:hypothetical protein